MELDHDNHLCASLGHFVGGVTLAYCPHYQSWVMVVRAGDETDDTSWRMETVRFGPFDSDDDVLRHALGELQRVLRADRAGWAGSRTPRES
jgi:hypothetical protein